MRILKQAAARLRGLAACYPGLCFTGILAALLLLVYHRLLWGQDMLYWRDFSNIYMPQFEYIGQQLRQGVWPWWNPLLFAGHPQLGALEPPLLYPGTWCFALGAPEPTAAWLILLHQLLAGCGTFALGRALGHSQRASACMGLAFALSGSLFSLDTLYPLLWTLAWLPWILLGAETWCAQGRGRDLLLLTGAMALQLLSGHVDMVFMCWLLLGAFVLWRCRPGPALLRQLGGCLAASCLAAGLAAPQLLATFELLPFTSRSQTVDYQVGEAFSFFPPRLPDWFVPYFFGDFSSKQNLMGALGDPLLNDSLLLSVYAGIFACLLALIALSLLRTRPEPRGWALALGFYLAASFGKYTPFHGWLYDYLPGFSMIRYPEKFCLLASFCLAVLAGIGYDACLRRQVTPRRMLACACLLAALLAGLLLAISYAKEPLQTALTQRYFTDFDPAAISKWFRPVFAELAAHIALGLALTLAAAWLLRRQLQGRRYASWLLLAGLALELLLVNRVLVWHAPEPVAHASSALQGLAPELQTRMMHIFFTPLVPQAYAERYAKSPYFAATAIETRVLQNSIAIRQGFHALYGNAPIKLKQTSDLYYFYLESKDPRMLKLIEDLYAVRYIVSTTFPERDQLLDSLAGYRRIRRDPDAEMSLWERSEPSARVSFLTQALVREDASEPIAMLQNLLTTEPPFDFTKQLILDKDAAYQQALAAIPPAPAAAPAWQLSQLSESSNGLSLTLETNTSGYLLLRDNYFPGWHVYVDGREQPVLRANGFQRAVRVGPGKHQISWSYFPTRLGPGLALAGLSTGLALAAAVLLRRRRSQARPEAQAA